MTLLLAFLVIAVAIAWFAWPRRAAARPEPAAPAGGLRAALSRVTGYAGRLRLPFRRKRELAGQLSEWLQGAGLPKRLTLYKRLPEDAAEFGEWLAALSPAGLDDLAETLANQCRALGFELTWLTEERIPRELRRSLEDAVTLSILATWNARHAQPLAAYVAWQQAPERAENRDFAANLFTRLVEAGLVTPPPAMLVAPEKQRRKMMARAIRDAAAEHQAAFVTALQATAGTQTPSGGES
jgi:hypothetical protein